MGKALYRQYRPKTLNEVIGQDHITTTLKNALKSGKISHAYLFTGPKGVGKTSIARILAHEVNSFDYEINKTYLDIIEIDAASNRRIDEIRDLRDKVHIAPSSGKYKVYIIDEVHMLTKEAFNALLKTLEEPPDHVIFILATTESHKLPDTIISRTQRFSFKPVDNKLLVEHLQSIAKQEKIKIDNESLVLIAEHSEGSFRDSISLLDQASSINGKVNVDDVRRMLGIAPQQAINDLLDAIHLGDAAKLSNILDQLQDQGLQAALVAKQLCERLMQDLVQNQSKLDSQMAIKLIKSLIAVPSSSSPEKLLEIVLLEIVFERPPQKQLDSVTIDKIKEVVDFKVTKKPTQTITVGNLQPKQEEINANAEFDLSQWQKILDDLKVRHNTLYGILRMGQPTYQDGELTLSFKFSFHQKRINEPRMHEVISNTFVKMGIKPVKITSIVNANTKQPKKQVVTEVDIAAISNIFGDTEVLES